MNSIIRAAVLAAMVAACAMNQAQGAPIAIAPSDNVSTTVNGKSWSAFHFDVSALEGIELGEGRSV